MTKAHKIYNMCTKKYINFENCTHTSHIIKNSYTKFNDSCAGCANEWFQLVELFWFDAERTQAICVRILYYTNKVCFECVNCLYTKLN